MPVCLSRQRAALSWKRAKSSFVTKPDGRRFVRANAFFAWAKAPDRGAAKASGIDRCD